MNDANVVRTKNTIQLSDLHSRTTTHKSGHKTTATQSTTKRRFTQFNEIHLPYTHPLIRSSVLDSPRPTCIRFVCVCPRLPPPPLPSYLSVGPLFSVVLPPTVARYLSSASGVIFTGDILFAIPTAEIKTRHTRTYRCVHAIREYKYYVVRVCVCVI